MTRLDTKTITTRAMIDAIREILGKDPLYARGDSHSTELRRFGGAATYTWTDGSRVRPGVRHA